MSIDLLDLARTIGRAAASYVGTTRPAGRVPVAATKSSPTDVVTAIDKATERLIRDRILAQRPDDGFVGEEEEDVVGTSGTEWIVDPIDGTVNFVYGLPFYAVSIAASVDGTIEAGFVINIASGEEFAAVRGAGAVRSIGGVDISLAPPADPRVDQALVATGFNYVPAIRTRQAQAVAALLPHIRDIRRTGSAALDLCALAAGELDAYVEQGLKPWDLAAGRLIAEESGVLFAGVNEVPDERLVIAAHPAIAEEFFVLVRGCAF